MASALPYVAPVAEQRGSWRTFGERTIYDNRWVRLGLVDAAKAEDHAMAIRAQKGEVFLPNLCLTNDAQRVAAVTLGEQAPSLAARSAKSNAQTYRLHESLILANLEVTRRSAACTSRHSNASIGDLIGS